jgi:hypothetical protein
LRTPFRCAENENSFHQSDFHWMTGADMSLTVPSALLTQAHNGVDDDEAFVACVRDSLPYAWNVIAELAERLRAGGGQFADNQTPPPDEAARGQLLRALASDAIRGSLERHFGVRLAFQNCHRVAVFAPAADAARRDFSTPRAQILNQTPELRDC